MKSPVLTGRVSPAPPVSPQWAEDFAVGGVRRVTSETEEPVEVGLDESCEMFSDGDTCSEHCFP